MLDFKHAFLSALLASHTIAGERHACLVIRLDLGLRWKRKDRA